MSESEIKTTAEADEVFDDLKNVRAGTFDKRGIEPPPESQSDDIPATPGTTAREGLAVKLSSSSFSDFARAMSLKMSLNASVAVPFLRYAKDRTSG